MGEPQILRISPDEYHERDGLSASVATTLINKSPLHAWSQHPKYGGKSKDVIQLENRSLGNVPLNPKGRPTG